MPVDRACLWRSSALSERGVAKFTLCSQYSAMIPRPLYPLLAFCLFFCTLGKAASDDESSGNSGKPQPRAIVQKTITVEVMTPDGAWELKIEEVRKVRNELWVFAKVERPNGALGAMMKSAASDQIVERLPDLIVC